MVVNSAIHSFPLLSLPPRTLAILSSLNSPKVIPSDGVVMLPRDWTGLSFLVNISAEIESAIKEYPDQTGKVLEIWLTKEKNATVGDLLRHLRVLDRYDVHDDVCEDLWEAIRNGEISANEYKQIAASTNYYNDISVESELKQSPHRQNIPLVYDAIVLYSNEDKGFYAEIFAYLDKEGYQVCNVDDLIAYHSAHDVTVAQLMSKLCRRIILVCTPEFLNSAGMSFYLDYTRTKSLESDVNGKNSLPVLPVIYRNCILPDDIKELYKLYYGPSYARPTNDFWERLRLQMAREITTKTHKKSLVTSPEISIEKLPLPENKSRNNSGESDNSPLLPLASSVSMLALNSPGTSNLKTADSQSLGNVSQNSSTSSIKKKTKTFLFKLVPTFTRKSKRDSDSDTD